MWRSSSERAAAGTGSIVGYSWSFGDGGTSFAQNPSHTYSAGGNFTVTLKVTQTDGLTATAQHTVNITASQASGGSGGSATSRRRRH